MTKLISRRKNSMGGVFPSMMNDFLPNRFFNGSLFDFDDDFFTSTPPANITENENEFKLDLSAPGMNKEDFKINLENGILTVSSEKGESDTIEQENYRRREFSYNSFSRVFALPDNIDENKITATYNNGILELQLPKKEGAVSKPRKKITVR